jgi:hypothetical protein
VTKGIYHDAEHAPHPLIPVFPDLALPRPKGVLTMKKTIRFERQNGVGRIVLANPPFNRLDLQFSGCLRQAVHEASESDIRVLVIQAEGPHFSFGGEVREWPGKDINWFRTFVTEVNLSYRAIEALRVPTIAAVQGFAFGGGFELTLACDFIVAAENAVLRCVEVTTGMLPLAGSLQRLAERLAGDGQRASLCSEYAARLHRKHGNFRSRSPGPWRVNLGSPRTSSLRLNSHRRWRLWPRSWRLGRQSPTRQPERY